MIFPKKFPKKQLALSYLIIIETEVDKATKFQ